MSVSLGIGVLSLAGAIGFALGSAVALPTAQAEQQVLSEIRNAWPLSKSAALILLPHLKQ